MRGRTPAFFDHRIAGVGHRRASRSIIDREAIDAMPRGASSLSPWCSTHRVERHAEPLGHDLHEAGFVALPLALRGDVDVDTTVRD